MGAKNGGRDGQGILFNQVQLRQAYREMSETVSLHSSWKITFQWRLFNSARSSCHAKCWLLYRSVDGWPLLYLLSSIPFPFIKSFCIFLLPSQNRAIQREFPFWVLKHQEICLFGVAYTRFSLLNTSLVARYKQLAFNIDALVRHWCYEKISCSPSTRKYLETRRKPWIKNIFRFTTFEIQVWIFTREIVYHNNI